MSLEDLIQQARKAKGFKPYMPNAKYVKPWWPKPKIKYLDKYWKFVCYSPSVIGFHPTDSEYSKTITAECKAYGSTPEEAYDKWCGVFPSWNRECEWTDEPEWVEQ